MRLRLGGLLLCLPLISEERKHKTPPVLLDGARFCVDHLLRLELDRKPQSDVVLLNTDRCGFCHSSIARSLDRFAQRLTIGSSNRGVQLRWAKEEVDDVDKSASGRDNAPPRRSSILLGTRSCRCERFNSHEPHDVP